MRRERAMQTNDIDKLIERYAEERKSQPRQVAQDRFVTRTHLLCRNDEVEPFLKQTRVLLTYYINSLSLFDNPFRNTQIHWLLFMFGWFCFSIYMIINVELRMLGIVICTGTVIFGKSLWTMVWDKWLETSLLIAYYNEIIEFIDSQYAPETSIST